ncbi:MAG: type II toxin-antitoxin system HicB family antitoxin [Treponema sp.]|jgi:predicted HicB family RNase H-like nuclease|nr:type II toxin-antitoxin system HicB family antitoxin [Treponema sp.]
MKTMRYKDYAARIEYSDEDKCFVGHIAGIRDIVGFHGESVDELNTAFQEAVDDYLEVCEKENIPPQRPYSGKVMLRVSPELHAEIAMKAAASGKSLNQWAAETLGNR